MRPSRLTVILIALSSIGCQYGGSRLTYCQHCHQFHMVAASSPVNVPPQTMQSAAPAVPAAIPGTSTSSPDGPPEPFLNGKLAPLESAFTGTIPTQSSRPRELEPSEVKQVLNKVSADSTVQGTVTTAGQPANHN